MTDPSDHLLNFVAVEGVSGWTLPYWCHMFALTFTGATREWFEKLPDGQIKSWDDFVANFSQHFSQQKKHTRDPSEILDVVRRNNESIEDFITRFNNESLNTSGVSENMLRGTFRKNLKSDELIWTLTGKDGSSTRGSNNWTPLSKTPAEILTTEDVNFRKPQPLTRRSFLDSKKHCSHHDDIGHNTNECVALKIKIEAAVKSGKLGHLVKGGRPGIGKAPARDNQGPPKKQVKDLNVHMIQGGHRVSGKRREFLDEE
ncbi:uncharacterized protein LOC143636451 [Bidens hawaiensis]|uniref:uncharacterized protein LOC143636451 n=1 Tax=Bidens hawaiensis TaxID=980011 RepID=UPI00404B7436